MIGLIATLIAAVKRHTGFAIFAGILSVGNIYMYLGGEAEDVWIFGWILFVIALFMKTKEPQKDTIIINNSPQTPPHAPTQEIYEYYGPKEIAEGGKFCSNCGKPLQFDDKFCPNCGSKVGHQKSEIIQ